MLSGILSCAVSVSIHSIQSKSLPPEESSVKCTWSHQIRLPFDIIRCALPLLVTWPSDTGHCCCWVLSGLAWKQKWSHFQLKRNHGRNPFISPVLWGNTGDILEIFRRLLYIAFWSLLYLGIYTLSFSATCLYSSALLRNDKKFRSNQCLYVTAIKCGEFLFS